MTRLKMVESRASNNIKIEVQDQKAFINLYTHGLYINGYHSIVNYWSNKPKQCMRCCKFGHLSHQCRNSESNCLDCGGKHEVSECHNKTKKCYNCQDSHTADDRSCKYFIELYEDTGNIHLNKNYLDLLKNFGLLHIDAIKWSNKNEKKRPKFFFSDPKISTKIIPTIDQTIFNSNTELEKQNKINMEIYKRLDDLNARIDNVNTKLDVEVGNLTKSINHVVTKIEDSVKEIQYENRNTLAHITQLFQRGNSNH